MYEITLNSNQIKKYFICISNHRTNDIALVSISIDIDEFVDYISDYIDYNDLSYSAYFYKSSSIEECEKIYQTAEEILDDEKLIFSFPDEGTAFYFKLKFC